MWIAVTSLPENLRQQSGGRIRRSVLVDGNSGKRKLEVAWSSRRRILHETLDMGPKSWSIRYALYGHWNLRGSVTADPHHRRHDNAALAMTRAGLRLLRLEMGLALSFVNGPWEGETWHGTLVDAIEEWNANSTSRDPLFELLYPRLVIGETQNRPPSDYGSLEHIEAVWRALPHATSLVNKGDAFRYNRWFSFERKVLCYRRQHAVLLAAALYVSVKRGYMGNVEECGYNLHKEDCSADSANEPNGHPEVSTAAGARPGAAGTGRSVKLSNDALKRLRSDCKTHLDLACRILMLEEHRVVMQGCALLCDPLAREHSNTIIFHKTCRGSRQWHVEMATGTRCNHVVEIMETLLSKDTLTMLGVLSHRSDGSSEFAPAVIDRVVTSWALYCQHNIELELAFLRSYSHDVPNAFSGLLAEDEATQRGTADWLVRAFSAVSKMEEAAWDDRWYAERVLDLVWPKSVWCREMMISLLEMGEGATKLPEDTRTEVDHFSRGPRTTKTCEDCFNVLSKAQGRSGSGKFGHRLQWWTAMKSPLLKENDFTPLVPEQEDIETAAHASSLKLPDKLFTTVGHVSSLDEAVEKTYMDGPRQWATSCPERYMRKADLLQALMTAGHGALKRAFLHKLVIPGTLLLKDNDRSQDVYWVLSVHEWGITCWEMQHFSKGAFEWFLPSTRKCGPRPWSFRFIATETASWHVLELETIGPLTAAIRLGCPPGVAFDGGVIFVPKSPVRSAREHAAMYGFRSALFIPKEKRCVTLTQNLPAD